MKDYHSAARRNFDNDYRCSVRQRADPKAVKIPRESRSQGREDPRAVRSARQLPEDPVRLPDGTLVGAPLEDEIAPEAPQWPVPHHHRLYPAGSKEPGREDMGDSMALPITRTPKRARDNS